MLHGLCDAGRADDPHDPGAVGTDPRRHRRALRSEPDDVLAGQHHADGTPVEVGESPRRRADAGVELAAEGAAVAERARWFTTGHAPRGVRFEIGRLDPRRPQRSHPVTVGQREWPRERRRRAPTEHGPGRPASVGDGLADRPRAVGSGNGYERVGGRTVVCEPTRTEGDERSDGLRRATLESRPPRRRLEITTGRHGSGLADRRRGLVDRLPARAPAQVGTERTIDCGMVEPTLDR